MKRMLLAATSACLIVGACSTSHHGARAAAPGGTSAETSATSTQVHTITLPHYQPNLPEAPGRALFASNCLSCHSTRYITMQPASFDQTVWETEVKKMVKPYGAPIADDVVTPIAQYIVAARKADPGIWETAAVEAKPASFASSSTRAGDMNHGQALYAHHCASCHGEDGKSNTVAAKPLLPPPTDLTTGRFTAAAIAAAITGGVRGTAMPAFPTLSQSDVRDIVAYTEKFAPEASAASPAGDDAEAKKLYQTNCASCHGADGAGDGPAAPPLARVPANFHGRQPAEARAVEAIANGVPGTAMPAWKAKLPEPQRAALARYVRTMYETKR